MADRVAPAAVLLRLALDEPRLDADDVIRERDIMIEEARQVADDTFRYPFRLAFRGAFGDSAYGLPAGGLEETLAALTPERVASWQREAIRGRRLTVVAVGDLEPERAADELAAVFAGWQGTARAATAPVGVGARHGARRAGGRAGQGAVRLRDALSGPVAARCRPARRRGVGRGGERPRRPAVRRAPGAALARLYRAGDGLAAGSCGRAGHVHRHVAGARGGSARGDAAGTRPVRRANR